MSLKCLNCHMVCAADDPSCPFCNYKITNTSSSLKKSSALGGAKYALVFSIVGATIFNTIVAPKMYPSSRGHINGEQLMMAALVGAGCAMLGIIFGWLVSGNE